MSSPVLTPAATGNVGDPTGPGGSGAPEGPAGSAVPRRRLTLTTRLVVTLVVLLGVTAVAIGGAAALALRSYLTGEVDAQLSQMSNRRPPDAVFEDPNAPSPFGGRSPFNQAPDALSIRDGQGQVANYGDEASTVLSDAQVAAVQQAASSNGATLTIPGIGSYRVMASSKYEGYIVGMPMDDVNQATQNLLVWEGLLTVTGLLVAGLIGQALVRRQLAPLREVAATAHRVAATPMASGAVQPVERVPDTLIGTSAEVGQVGSALNTLLDHVENSLTARHESEQQVRQFVADASHELRTPLATVRGYSELARRNPDDAEQAQIALEKVQQESARMSTLVEDLLLLARLDQGRALAAEPVDLRALAVEAVVDAQVISPDHEWNLDLGPEDELDLEDSSRAQVLGDPMRLHQVVSNLVTNAWRHTPGGTAVTVSVSPIEDGVPGVRLVVADNGPGIEAALLPHVFERFTRGDRARTRGRGSQSNGTGLGLSTVRAIVLAHGGTVSVQSSEGHGTRFVVDLPRSPALGS